MPPPPGMPAPGMPPVGIPGLMGMGIPGMMPPVMNLKADLMQRTKKCRRVHIGNLPINVGLTPEALKQFVNTVMQQLALTVKPGEPVIDSFVSSDGKFGFVEMRTIQEATNALNMSGADCFGRPIRVGKPADYVPPDAALITAAMGSGLLGTPGDEGVGVGEFNTGPDMSKVLSVLSLALLPMLSLCSLALALLAFRQALPPFLLSSQCACVLIRSGNGVDRPRRCC